MLFDDQADPLGGVTLSPTPAIDPLGQQSAPGPDVMPLVSSLPRLPMPPPVAMPPAPMSDPRQRLLALFATGLALGAGPRSGLGAGALHGLGVGEQAIRQDQMARWQVENERQRQAAKDVEQQQAILDRQRANDLTQTFSNFTKAMQGVTTEQDYQRLVGAYAGGLQAKGYRITPQYFYDNFKFTPPSDQQQIQKAVSNYFDSPLVKELLKSDPNKAYAGAITYTTTRDGKKQDVRLTIPEAMKALGQDLNVDATGDPLFSSLGKGTEAQQAMSRATAEFTARFGRQPDPTKPQDNDWITNRAHQFTNKTDPALDEMNRTLKQIQIDNAKRAAEGEPTAEDAARVASDLINHRKAPSQIRIGFGKQGQQFQRMVEREVQKLDPSFDWEQAESEYNLAKSPGFQNTVRYMDSVSESIPRVLETAKKLGSGRVRLANTVSNLAKTQINDPTLKAFVTDTLLVSDEVAKILQGGGSGSATSDAKLRQASQILNESDSPQAIASAMNEIQVLIGNRRRALTRGTYMEGTGQSPNATAPVEIPKGVTIRRGRAGA